MSLSLEVQKGEAFVPSARYDAVVLGAGPYGLSAAAHLKAQNLKVAIFGKPIYFWREHMPEGMLLRSYWWATNLSDPQGKYGFDKFFALQGMQGADPLPMKTFVEYGLWFQQNAVPELDETYIQSVEWLDGSFLLTLEDGRVIQSQSVVMAPGLQYYMYTPAEYAHMPTSLVSHSAMHRKLSKFAGQRVVLIGAGQAALETAALLGEQGAEVQLIARHPIRWINFSNENIPEKLRGLRAPQAGMGEGWLNLILEKYPYVFQRLPRNTKDHLLATRHAPAGSHWLKPRVVEKITLHEAEKVESVTEAGEHVKLRLSSGTLLEADHVILGTGYRADIKRLSMLQPNLQASIQCYDGSPILSTYFESSVPGLYFIGYSAARSFGPFYRFVIGDEAAARRVTRAISRRTASLSR